MSIKYTEERRVERRLALQNEKPEYQQLIERIRVYLSKTLWPMDLLAQQIGYSNQTLDCFMQGRYHDNNRSIRIIADRLIEFMERHPAGDAEEQIGGRLHRTENVDTLERWFAYCQERGKMCCIYGPPGSQKTFIMQHIIAEQHRAELARGKPYHRAFYIYCSEGIKAPDLIRRLMQAVALPTGRYLQNNLSVLRFALRSQRVIFIFDEAQHLSNSCLEVIRELNDLRPHFGIMLLGSHELQQRFIKHAAELEQWNSRISQAIELPGISNEAAERILRDELGQLVRDEKVKGLLDSCMVVDIYAKRGRKTYLSARKLFNSIEVIKERATPQGQHLQGGVQ